MSLVVQHLAGQLALLQVVQELKGAGYEPRMAYLGAKRHYCIHHKVSKAENMSVDEACDDLLGKSGNSDSSGKGCQFYNGFNKAMNLAYSKLKVRFKLPACMEVADATVLSSKDDLAVLSIDRPRPVLLPNRLYSRIVAMYGCYTNRHCRCTVFLGFLVALVCVVCSM